MANPSLQNLFAALSGVSSGGTSAPYTSVSSPTGNMPGIGGGQQPNSPGTGAFQGNWQGNMSSQMQPQQPQQGAGMGLQGMFKDIMGRAPAIYNAMQNKPGAPPMNSFMSGMNQGMQSNAYRRY